jgi:hypothetical protein
MAGNPQQIARTWAKHALANPTFKAKLEENHAALMLRSIEPGGLDSVTSATKNAVTMAKSVGLSVADSMTAMGWALEWVCLGYVPRTSRTTASFQ